MLHTVEDREGLRGDEVPELLLYHHGDLDGVKRVEAVLGQGAIDCDALLVSGPEVVSEQVDHEPRG